MDHWGIVEGTKVIFETVETTFAEMLGAPTNKDVASW